MFPARCPHKGNAPIMHGVDSHWSCRLTETFAKIIIVSTIMYKLMLHSFCVDTAVHRTGRTPVIGVDLVLYTV